MVEQNKSAPQDSTKNRILETAIVEFAEYGLAGARVDRIAENAGVNKAMIYYHLNSKENLYYSSLAEGLVGIIGKLQRQVSMDKSLEEIVSSIVEEHLKVYHANPYFKKIMLRELAEDESAVVKKMTDYINQTGTPNILYNKLLSEMENGNIRRMDPKQAIASLISMNIGFFIISPMTRRILNITEIDKFVAARKDAIVDLFLNGVMAR